MKEIIHEFQQFNQQQMIMACLVTCFIVYTVCQALVYIFQKTK